MSLPYPIDPSLPSNPSPLFSDSEAARGDHLRANNGEIWANFDAIVSTILGGASLSTDATFSALSDLLFPSQKAVYTYIHSLLPVGSSIDFSGTVIPSGWMKEDGSSLLRASYSALWGKLHKTIGTCTISNASPAIVTLNEHGLITGDCVHLTTNDTLPTGLSSNTNYYVVFIDANTFNLAATFNNALAGTKINTSSAGSGTHACLWVPWGAADAAHFYLPDTQGLSTEGSGQLTTNGAAWGSSEYAGRLGQYRQDQMQLLTGNVTYITTGASSASSGALTFTPVGAGPTLGAGNNYGTLSIDSANSPDARTSSTTAGKTAGPRVGKWKIIKVI